MSESFMNWKKNLSYLLIASIFISLTVIVAPTSGAKSSITKVKIDYYGQPAILDPNLTPGKRFQVNVTVTYVERLWAYQVTLGEPIVRELIPGWDPSVLKLVNQTNGPFLGSFGGKVSYFPGEIDNTYGVFVLAVGALDPKERFPTGGGTLMTLTFEVVGVGSSPIRFGLDTALLNETGGFQLGPELDKLFRGTHNPGFLVDGYFDNRPLIHVRPPSNVTGVPEGENFTISVEALNVEGLHDWRFSLRWNSTLLNLTSATEGDFLKEGGATTFDAGEIDNTFGRANISASLIDPGASVTGSGVLANLTFAVKEEGRTNITILHDDTILRRSDGGEISIACKPRVEACWLADGFFTNLKVHKVDLRVATTPKPPRVKEGSLSSISVHVTVENTGDFNETGINVTARVLMDNEEVWMETVKNITLDLEANSSITLNFVWNTTAHPRGIYTIIVEAVGKTVRRVSRTIEAVIWAHDVAVVSVRPINRRQFQGFPVRILVNVTNEGTEFETFRVTVYYDGNEIRTQDVTELGCRESELLEFVWNTTDVPLGNYTIRARATVVEGEEEEDRADNEAFSARQVTIIPLENPYSLEFILLITLPFIIVGAMAFLYVKRRKPAET
jgi:hypothetical protein